VYVRMTFCYGVSPLRFGWGAGWLSLGIVLRAESSLELCFLECIEILRAFDKSWARPNNYCGLFGWTCTVPY
jgi:hypothetical protein